MEVIFPLHQGKYFGFLCSTSLIVKVIYLKRMAHGESASVKVSFTSFILNASSSQFRLYALY